MQDNERLILPVELSALTAEQEAVIATFPSGTRIQEPVGLLLHNPSLAQAIYPVLNRLRYRSELSDKLRELVTLIASQVWQQGFEWQVHAPLAADVGLAQDIIAAISRGDRPFGMDDEEAAVHDFCRSLHATKFVDNEVYRRTEALLGAAGILELCWLSGSYASLAMVMNVAGSPPSWATATEA